MTTKYPTDPHRDDRERVLRLLGDDGQKNERRKYGTPSTSLIQCTKHGEFYPKSESCPWCLPFTPAAVKPVRFDDARTPGRRCFDKWRTQYPLALWIHEDHQEWEEFAKDRVMELGPDGFDAFYP